MRVSRVQIPSGPFMHLSAGKIEKEIEKAEGSLIVVEGKKDKAALQQLGFTNIFVINETGKSLSETIEEIESIVRQNKNKACILTDFDKKGKSLYMTLKSKFSERGVRLDNSLRSMLLKMRISHIEGLSSFLEKRI